MIKSLEQAKKHLKADTTGILILMIMFFSLSAHSLVNAIRYSKESLDAYEVVLVEEDSEDDKKSCNYYAIYIDGVEYGELDYNEYCNIEEEKVPDYLKATCVAHEGEKAIQCVIIGFILFCLLVIFMDVKRGKTPFQKRSVDCLRIAAILTMCVNIVPWIVRLMTLIVCLESVTIFGNLTPSGLFVIAIGGVIWMIAEIFKYGCALQEDSDLIA
ncbi:MAG: DUF2975 domain-containing protein [Lachnospiraceae bacterium]|nr:DUF2975 domain-containing protein [Lachnospiraceae bacterium]